jgi:hypothetical protein
MKIMIDYSHVRLGRNGLRHDPRRRLAAHKILALLPPPPAECDNTNGITSWQMMANDSLGDCTCAGLGHSLQVATLAEGKMITPPNSTIIGTYEKYCGYNPADPDTDQGGVELDILSGIKRDGFAGDELLGFVSPDPQNLDHIKKSICYFRSVYIGAELPLSAKQSGLWDVVAGANGVAGAWGGHCMVAPRYTADGKIGFVTWGENQLATLGWWQKYVDECHVLLWKSMLALWPASTQQSVLSILQDVG